MKLSIWHGTGLHRAPSRAELAKDNQQLQERLAAADALVLQLVLDRDNIKQDLDTATTRYTDAETVVTCQQNTIDTLSQKVTELSAQVSELCTISVPAGHRDIAPGDEPTEPAGINVVPLRAAFGLPLSAAPTT